nr:protein kinase, ATP binding site-containing protein [Tanacetum cinerariifolium]
MILVYEYAVNGSLESHLENPNKIRYLTWVKRLKICLGAVKGLDYLYSGLGEDNKVIHRDVKSGNILLDDNLEVKICDFGFSKSDSTKNLMLAWYRSNFGDGKPQPLINLSISFNSKKHPTMEMVVDKIEEALDFQENGECGDADYVAAWDHILIPVAKRIQARHNSNISWIRCRIHPPRFNFVLHYSYISAQ